MIQRTMVRWMLLACVLAAGCGGTAAPRHELYQFSTLYALMEGAYDGEPTLADVARHGDMGIGTFDGLDGEMILLDGRFYQVRADGKVVQPPLSATTPLTSVTRFPPCRPHFMDGPADWIQVQQAAERHMASKNVPYAVRIRGQFDFVKTRSVPRQTPPYPRLTEVTKSQPTFEMKAVKGTLVGFWFPEYMKGVAMPGWHMHFLADDLSGGGHLLACQARLMSIELQEIDALTMDFPRGAFRRIDLSKDTSQELKAAEKATAK